MIGCLHPENKRWADSVCTKQLNETQPVALTTRWFWTPRSKPSQGFIGYGWLGHVEQKVETVPPHQVKLFDFPGRGVPQIYAGYDGYTCSFADSEVGGLFF